MIKRLRSPDTNYDLSQRTPSESLWLWRHRQTSKKGTSRGRRSGSMSQAEAAGLLDVTLQQYIKLEAGESTLISFQDFAKMDMVRVSLQNQPTRAELCFLARRRSGLSVREIAREMGISSVTYSSLEAADDPRVMKYWIMRGYVFPLQEDAAQ